MVEAGITMTIITMGAIIARVTGPIGITGTASTTGAIAIMDTTGATGTTGTIRQVADFSNRGLL